MKTPEESKALSQPSINKKYTNSDYEEGEFPSEEEPLAASARFKFVARLPAYCRVNPNLPVSATNQQLAIVRGIDRHQESLNGNFGESGMAPAGEGQTKYRLSDFDKIEKIGEGTFGKVYKAEYKDPHTGEVKYYALKKLKMIMDEMTD